MQKSEKLMHPFLYLRWMGGDAIDCNNSIIIKYNCNFWMIYYQI